MSGSIGLDPRIGTELLGYRIDALVGRGGMGVVYRAYDLRLKRNVALKLVAPEWAGDERFRERFLDETELAASLEHPDVVPIYDAGEVEGQLYLAMRFVEGTDLKRLLAGEAPLEQARALAIVSHVADALDAAHERGLVHRDVKPSNVLLDEREHPYLADFGLTRRLDDPGSTSAGLSVGTPAYVAPEQIRGDTVDGRSDQYALACMLHECLTGEPPFRRPSEVALLFAHLEDEPPTLGNPLDPVLARALAKDPAERYSTCAELVGEARKALGLEKPVRGRRLLFGAALLTTLAAAALAAVLLTRDSGTPLPETSGRLIRIDPTTNRATDTVPVGNDPSAVAADESGVWVADRAEGSVWRIDPDTKQVELKTPTHGKPVDVVLSASRALVTNGPLESSIAVIDAAAGGEEDLISLATGGLLYGSAHAGGGASGVWVATADRRVGRLNLGRGTLFDPVVIPWLPDERSDSGLSSVAVGPDAVWVIGDPLDRSVRRIDPISGRLTATIPLSFSPTDVAVGEGAVWITSHLDDTVSRLDTSTNEITATIPVGKGAAGVAVGVGSVWVANALEGTVSRIDPATLQIETIDVEGIPEDVAIGSEDVWVMARTRGSEAGDGAVGVGVLAACEGSFGNLAQSSFAGAELPLLMRGAALSGSTPTDGIEGAAVVGKDIDLVFACSDESAKRALTEARRLVELAGADIVIGSYSAGEAFAIREYARRRPDVTFLDGISSNQGLTLHEPAPNVFRFATDAAQWMAGMGDYAYNDLGWRRVVTIGDADGFSYSQAAGFTAEFCSLGGRIAKQIWVPPLASDLSQYLDAVPAGGIDGFLLLGLPPTIVFFAEELPQLAGKLGGRVIGGILISQPSAMEALGRRLDGVVAGGPDPFLRRTAKWQKYLSEFDQAFPDLKGFGIPPFAHSYHNAMQAVLEALEAVDGDLSGDQRRFQAALAEVELDAPTGNLKLDARRQAIGPNYNDQIYVDKQGRVTWRPLRTIENVEQTFNGYFSPDDQLLGPDTIPCKKGNPPPWARG
ncbi:MAG TPA: ABC transporter substrate-binding protein [Gaiellaceae bacterium]|nr:ABC transporter substrate-binding protein [Gaiellaceae bacterium]